MDKKMLLSQMELFELEKLNDLYMEHPGIDLPFAHDDILDEIFRHNDQGQIEQLAEVLLQKIKEEGPRQKKLVTLQKVKTLLLVVLCFSILWMAAVAAIPRLFQFARQNDTILAAGSGKLEMENGGDYSSLEEALTVFGIERAGPTWIPMRYSLEFVTVEDLGETVNIYAWYGDKEGSGFSVIVLALKSEHMGSNQSIFEVDGTYEEIKIGGIKHYFESNMERPTAKWEGQNCIVSITGDLSPEELKKVVKSIYK